MLFSLTRPLSIAAFSLLATLPLHAQFTDRVWQGADGAVWHSTADNWSPADIPNANTERAVINGTLDGGATVIYSYGNGKLGGLDIASGFTLTRAAGDTSNRTITLDAATTTDSYFNNAGTISSGGESGLFAIIIHEKASTIVNSGIIEATAGTELRLQSNSNNSITITNTGGTIRTSGNGILHLGTTSTNPVNITGGSLQNAAGTINQSRLSDLTDVTITNGGIYNVDTGTNAGNPWGTRLNGTTSLTNSGTLNIIRQFADSTGNLGQSNALTINSAEATLSNAGTINIIASGTLTTSSGGGAAGLNVNFDSEIVNTGTINLESRSATQSTRLSINTDATATLSGTGELVLAVGAGGDVSQVAVRGTGTSELINGTGHTIRGAGQLGDARLGTITNAGTITADSATDALTVDLNGTGTTGTFTNAGTLHAAGAAGLVMVDGAASNTGTVRVDAGSNLTIQVGSFTSTAGILQVDGTLATTPDLSIANTTITGQGSITGNVNIDGPSTFTPGGATTHVLTIGGNLAFNEAASAQTISFNFDHFDSRIDVTGALTHGLNNLLEFNFGTDAGYATNTTYTLFTTGGTDLLIDALSVSATSLSAGFALDSSFGSDGWQLDGNDLQVRFSGVAGIIPEPAQAALILGLFGAAAVIGLRRGRASA